MKTHEINQNKFCEGFEGASHYTNKQMYTIPCILIIHQFSYMEKFAETWDKNFLEDSEDSRYINIQKSGRFITTESNISETSNYFMIVVFFLR